jgi:hypothetical protein
VWDAVNSRCNGVMFRVTGLGNVRITVARTPRTHEITNHVALVAIKSLIHQAGAVGECLGKRRS